MLPYLITPQVITQTGRAHFKGRYFGRRLVLIAIYSAIVGMAMSYGGDPISMIEFGQYAVVISIFALLIFGGALGFVYYFQIPWQAKQNSAMQVLFSQHFSVHWNEVEISQTSEKHNSKDAFGDFAFWLEAGDHIMLYRTKSLYNVIPGDAFETAQERDDLIAKLVSAGVKPR